MSSPIGYEVLRRLRSCSQIDTGRTIRKWSESTGSSSVEIKWTLPVFTPPSSALAVSCASRNRNLPHNPKSALFLTASLYTLDCFRIGHDGLEYRIRRVIPGQQAGHGLEFSKIQTEDCLHGRESPGSKELKRVYLNILTNLAFGCPTHYLHGFSYDKLKTH